MKKFVLITIFVIVAVIFILYNNANGADVQHYYVIHSNHSNENYSVNDYGDMEFSHVSSNHSSSNNSGNYRHSNHSKNNYSVTDYEDLEYFYVSPNNSSGNNYHLGVRSFYVTHSNYTTYNYRVNNRSDFQQFGSVAPTYLNQMTLVRNQILIYTKYYNSDWNDIFTGEPLFKDDRCIYTTDPSALTTASHVIFHLRDVTKYSDLPTIKAINQKWIIYNIESAIVNRRYDAYELFKKISPQFDLTMTYRMDSDIPIPYGRVVWKNGNRSNGDVTSEINFKGKSKGIAWFVSNCKSLSRRENVVNKMQKWTHVDIYGHCGRLKCAIANERSYKNETCYKMLSRDYKFYLAFENSICTDYVTEKLFNILNYDVIPIVYGGANYSDILPYNSYIDVMNFTSVEKLVSYLEYVGSDETVYKSYFEWRNDFRVVGNFPDKLCDYVTEESIFDGGGNGNFFDWWFDGTCRDVKIW